MTYRDATHLKIKYHLSLFDWKNTVVTTTATGVLIKSGLNLARRALNARAKCCINEESGVC